jgi:hypothetical protein
MQNLGLAMFGRRFAAFPLGAGYWFNNRAITAGYPGNITLIVTPCGATAAGKAPATSAKPPVLIKGTASEARLRTRRIMPSVFP